jgi:hypothetical protein
MIVTTVVHVSQEQELRVQKERKSNREFLKTQKNVITKKNEVQKSTKGS